MTNIVKRLRSFKPVDFDNVFGEAANEIERLHAEIKRLEPMTMALCERHSLVLRVGVAYVFRPVGDCQRCAEMVAQARDAYGPSLGA